MDSRSFRCCNSLSRIFYQLQKSILLALPGQLTRQVNWPGNADRISIVPRSCKFALGLLVRGIAAAIPLAFGLGGLELVTGQLQK